MFLCLSVFYMCVYMYLDTGCASEEVAKIVQEHLASCFFVQLPVEAIRRVCLGSESIAFIRRSRV